jgi:DNA-directed RNA polymerase specialized sigma24 family protein
MQTRAVNQAVRSYHSFKVPASLSRDDVRQEAAIGVIAATRTLDASRPAHEQEAYLSRRALGAIQDACRRARRGAHVELDAMPRERRPSDPLDIASPELMAVVSQAMDAIARMPEPLPTLVRMALTGSSAGHIATAIGVSERRVFQLRNELAKRLTKFLTPQRRTTKTSHHESPHHA